TMIQAASALLGRDPGAGAEQEKHALQQALKKDLIPDSVDYRAIEIHLQSVDRDYLRRWAAALGSANPPSVERTARSVASHLLDAGFSAQRLHRWCTYQLSNASGANSLVELV